MKLIAHRGNTNGPFESWENEPTYIDLAIKKGFDVEVDIWVKDNIVFLGHDKPQYGGLDTKWFKERIDVLWVHCKNIEAVYYMQKLPFLMNYFWHETDTITLTSKGYIWAYPGKQPITNSIAVMPEINNDDTSNSFGICSDYVEKYL